MAVHKISVKQVVSRIRQVFPEASENYVLNLINDSLVEIGMFSTKPVQAKMSTVADQMWYKIGDEANLHSRHRTIINGQQHYISRRQSEMVHRRRQALSYNKRRQ